MAKLTETLKDNCPFISVIHYGGHEYIGIIINQDQHVTSIYNYELLKTDEERELFLSLGEIWWWESNRTIPINIFLKRDMDLFRHSIITMNSKDVDIVFGPTINLHNMTLKRVKRKTIQFVRPIKS